MLGIVSGSRVLLGKTPFNISCRKVMNIEYRKDDYEREKMIK